MKRDVTTFGSATVDIHVQTAASDIDSLCDASGSCEDVLAYRPGDKVLLEDVHIEVGGGGTNTAACLKKLNRSVAFAGAVGSDAHAEKVLSWLADNDISFVGMRADTSTNLSIILDSLQLHDRTILAYKSASDRLSFSELDVESLTATWWYFSSLLGEAHEAMLSLMRYAREHGIAVGFNPSSYQVRAGLESLREALELAQFFIVNKEEAELLVGSGSRADLCRRLREEGGEIVVVTEAEFGASMLFGSQLVHVSSCAEEVVETTGAGDCFSATVLYGLMKGLSPVDCLRVAALNAESMIRVVGAKNGLLGEEELLARLARDQRDVVEEFV